MQLRVSTTEISRFKDWLWLRPLKKHLSFWLTLSQKRCLKRQINSHTPISICRCTYLLFKQVSHLVTVCCQPASFSIFVVPWSIRYQLLIGYPRLAVQQNAPQDWSYHSSKTFLLQHLLRICVKLRCQLVMWQLCQLGTAVIKPQKKLGIQNGSGAVSLSWGAWV